MAQEPTVGPGWLGEHEKFILPTLEPISAYFSIPRLGNKPQDPIVQTIQLPVQSGALHNSLPAEPPSSPALSRAKVSSSVFAQVSKPEFTSLWNDASFHHLRDVDRSMSWSPNAPSSNRTSPFLTEQNPSLLGSLQNRAKPSVHVKFTKVARITESELFGSLHLVVLGTSSPLYVWDVHSQSFVRATSSDASEFNWMSQSILKRFLDLGTLVRRLEQLIQELRKRPGNTNTTVHAFAHGLSSVLIFIRNRLSNGPLSRATGLSGIHCLATVWLYYTELEQVVISLASMCSRNTDITPDRFSEIPISPVDLLSLVYETLEMHVERHSPRDITAIIAYILTVSSKPYIHSLCKLLAYGETRQVHTITTERTQLMDLTFEGDEVESTWRGEEGNVDAEGPFPKFIPTSLASILPAAHKSLKLLEGAEPEHPIFSTEVPSKEISWIWNEESIKNLWNELGACRSAMAQESNSPQFPLDDSQTEQSSEDRDPLAEFRVFDLEPESFSSSERGCQVVLDELIVSFPKMLPNITPSPSLLCELTFMPLQDHASCLSRALLAVFLDRSSFLCIDAHLELLRSHMLLTSHSFKSRLSAALFSDAEDRESHSVQLCNLLRYKSKYTTLPGQSHTGRWPVGLAPLLVTRDSWPPGGSELSFLLRAVIVDSQQNDPLSAEDTTSRVDGAHLVMNEAEFRLGFAIRELSGRGNERWLDPLSIEALDFLYLDYKVPHPLQALIPTAVLSKYQRIFALLLRLTRVECAIRSVFRLTRTTAAPLFPTLSSSRRVLLHFRFAAHSFLSTLATYIYDTAIGGNFGALLLRITSCRETPDAPNSFRDVFALAECHSSVLDDILSACLLRSPQRAGGDLLRGTLEVVLEFCVLVGDLKDGRMEEYQASPVQDALHASFRKKVSALMRTLEAMLEKHGKNPDQLQAACSEGESRVPPGGVDSLRHLLTCLNQNDWWMRP
ncbi:Spc98 family-domain-containing protein [Boletus reticuloceps]|uniref:Spindle pole body component n=1 Tax=Boletus reticuloceps TaxID=495285 RepID=A0A8I3AC40_9AGAM|nr:Spc98 family-domain-containing protein [Boletus reticuloceps]